MEPPARVLFIRLSAIGDIILTTPLLRLFHHHFPETKMDFLTKQPFKSLLQYNPLINEIITIEGSPSFKNMWDVVKSVQEKQYDIIFDLQKHWRSYFISWLGKAKKVARYKKFSFRRFVLVYCKKNLYEQVPQNMPERYFYALKGLQIKWEPYPSELFIPDDIQRKVNSNVSFEQNQHIIAIAPGAGRKTKRWPVHYFTDVMHKISTREKVQVLLLGDESDQTVCQEIEQQFQGNVINLCGKTNLLETAAAIKNCQMIICNDTGLMHIAAALKKRVVAIFGPTVKAFGFFPFGTDYQVLEHPDLDCRPCSYHGTEECPKGHFRCMLEVSPDQVVDAVSKIIG